MTSVHKHDQQPLPSPFSFRGPWKGEALYMPPLDFAAKRAAMHATHADKTEKEGFEERALQMRRKATHWRGLEHLSTQEAETLLSAACRNSSEHIDELLTFAKMSHGGEKQIAVVGSS